MFYVRPNRIKLAYKCSTLLGVRVWTAVIIKTHVIISHTRVWRNYELQSPRWEPQYHESVIGF